MKRIALAVVAFLVSSNAHAAVSLAFDSLTSSDALEHVIGPVFSEDGSQQMSLVLAKPGRRRRVMIGMLDVVEVLADVGPRVIPG